MHVINGMRLKTAYIKMVVYVLEPKVGIELNMLKLHTRTLPTYNHNDRTMAAGSFGHCHRLVGIIL